MKKTVGQQIQEHNAKNIQFEDDVRAYSEVMGQDIWTNVCQFAMDTSKRPCFSAKDFYVVLQINHDRRLHEPKFIIKPARSSCPTPCYKDTVWKYHHVSGDLEYLWHLPDETKAQYIMKHYMAYWENKETRTLAEFVKRAQTGELLRWVIKENGELPDAIITHKLPEA